MMQLIRHEPYISIQASEILVRATEKCLSPLGNFFPIFFPALLTSRLSKFPSKRFDDLIPRRSVSNVNTFLMISLNFL